MIGDCRNSWIKYRQSLEYYKYQDIKKIVRKANFFFHIISQRLNKNEINNDNYRLKKSPNLYFLTVLEANDAI